MRLGQVDKFTDLEETLKALDDSSEVSWHTELLPLCLECQAFMSMGNQQGTNLKASYLGSRGTSPTSPRSQIPRKRRRRVEGICSHQHKLKMTPKTQQVTPHSKRMTKVMSSAVFEEWCLGEKKSICTPAAQRKTADGNDRVERSISLSEESNVRRPQELKPAWGAELLNVSSANVHRSYSQKGALSLKEEDTLVDSDSDLSEYDNETHLMCISQSSIDPIDKTEDSTRNTVQSASQLGGTKAEGTGRKSSQRRFEEMAKGAAAHRVMVKIEEVEEIIRRVSLTSSDWIKEGSKGKNEPHFISEGCVGEDQLQILEQKCKAEFSTHSRLDNQDLQSSEDKPLVVEELRALAEAMNQSLHQALRMEGAKTESEPFIESKKTLCKQSPMKSTRRPPHEYHFTFNDSMVPNNSSSSPLSTGGETSSAPSMSLSAILDVSPRASSSCEKASPILSPLFLSSLYSLGPSQQSVPLNLSDQNEPDTSEDHKVETVEDSLFPCSCECATEVSSETEMNNRKNLAPATLWLNEQNQKQSYRCISETETSQDYLLFSGNNATMTTKIFIKLGCPKMLPHKLQLKADIINYLSSGTKCSLNLQVNTGGI